MKALSNHPYIASATLALVALACAEPETQIVRAESGGSMALVSEAPQSASQARVALHYIVGDAGNEARYRVRERLMGKDFDNDAIGVTAGVTGGIAVDSAGAIITSLSRFTVRMDALKSDSDRRDGYVRRRVLETDQHPTVTFVPTAMRGISPSAVTAKNASTWTFQLVGDLTVKGVTRPSTWQVTARRSGTGVVGSAATAFTFAEFGIAQPKVPIVLSVADTIRLEYDFSLTPAPTR